MQYPVVLAVDFGTKRIGLAISRGSLAEPLKIISVTDQASNEIRAICKAEVVEKIVVGVSENTMGEMSKKFAHELEAVTQLPVFLMDETLSSRTVTDKLQSLPRSSRKSAPGRRQAIDDLAAAEFLQQWLDESNN